MHSEIRKRKRFNLSLAARQTQTMLIGLFVSTVLVLFVTQLFLLNQLSTAGYRLTQAVEKKTELVDEMEKVDAEIARIQTQEFVTKTTAIKHQMVAKEGQQFVQIPLRFTAKK